MRTTFAGFTNFSYPVESLWLLHKSWESFWKIWGCGTFTKCIRVRLSCHGSLLWHFWETPLCWRCCQRVPFRVYDRRSQKDTSYNHVWHMEENCWPEIFTFKMTAMGPNANRPMKFICSLPKTTTNLVCIKFSFW